MNPAMIERLKAVENQAEAMGRGARSAYLKQQAQELGISLATLYRKLEAVSIKPTRKRRSDAGKTELKPEEAKLISAVLVEAMRRNGKRLMSVRQAVEMLRANGKIEAARIDGETGEVIPSVRTAFRPLARHRPHRPVMAHPRRRHEDQTPLYRPTVGLGGRNTPRAAHADRRQHPPFPRHPPTAQTRPPSRPHQHQIRPQRHPTTGLWRQHPRQIQTHNARIPPPLHQHQPDRRKRHPHNRPRPRPHQPRRPPTRRLLKPAPLPDRRQLPPPRAARTRRMVQPPPPPSIRSRRPKHLQ